MLVINKWVLFSIFAYGIMMHGVSQASSEIIETQHLIVSDATGTFSNEQLKSLADQAQATMNRILVFWVVANTGIDRFGKIKVVFGAPPSVFYLEKKDGHLERVVRVHAPQRVPHNMAHKIASAIFPQKDKLIRNVMGVLTEAELGNPLAFPMCGFSSDDWVLALFETKSYIPLGELGPEHESWGMKQAGGGKVHIFDNAKFHKAYAEAGSFANYLFHTYGIDKIKQFHQLSRESKRPAGEVFGHNMQELEESWLKALRANRDARLKNVALAARLLRSNPSRACTEAQNLSTGK